VATSGTAHISAVAPAALMWAVPDVATMTLLLDAGADVNARSDDQRSPALIASGIVGAAPALRLLLDYGADPVPRRGDLSPLREAARVNEPSMFRLLLDAGVSVTSGTGFSPTLARTLCYACAAMIGAGGPLPQEPPVSGAASTVPRYDPGRAARPTPVGDTPVTPAALRAAVERSLPLLQDVGVAFIRQTGCVSCHHNSVVSMAVAAARTAGYAVNDTASRAQTAMTAAYLESWREQTAQNLFIAGAADTISYVLFGLAEDKHPPDAATDAQAIWIAHRQDRDGHWPLQALRPPIESNEIEEIGRAHV